MTKASSFGGISVLSRENSCGRNVTPKITKAESFNLTSISCSPAHMLNDSLSDHHEVPTELPNNSVYTSSSAVTLQTTTCQFTHTVVHSDQVFPIVSYPPSEINISYIQTLQESNQQINRLTSAKDLPKDFNPAAPVGQPLTKPYSSESDVLFPNAFINPQVGYPRMAFSPSQPLSVSLADQVPTTLGHMQLGVSPSCTTQSSQRPQPSLLQSHVPQSQTTVNTSSPTVFYIPYVSQIQSSVSHHSSLAPVQSIRHSQSAHFMADPRPLILFPVCYLQPHTSNIHSARHGLSQNTSQPTSQCSPQSTSLHVTASSEVKSQTPTVSAHLLSPQYMPCLSALACTQSSEVSSFVTTTASVFPFSNVNIANSGTILGSSHKTFTSQPSQPSVCVQQSFMQLQTTSVSLPPVYVSITSSTQSPATRTLAGGHIAAQFSSSRSQSLPVSSSSTTFSHPLNSATQFLGYTVYAPPLQTMPSASHLTAVTITPNTVAGQPSQFTPAYLPAFQTLPPNVPLVANIGNTSLPLSSILRTQYPTPISTVSKVPLSFPLVKQASDPGVGEHVTFASNVCLVGSSVQHLGPLLLPQPPSIARFPRSSISYHCPANRLIKAKKYRSKGSTAGSTTHSSQVIFEMEGKHVLKVEGLTTDLKRSDVEHCLESITDAGAKIFVLNADSLKVMDEGSDSVVSVGRHIILLVFDTETAAQNALGIKTTKFQLRHWHRSSDCKNVKKA